MLALNDRLKIGNIFFDIQTEYKPTFDTIVSEIFKDGKILKKITRKRHSSQSLESQVKNLHSEVVNSIYRRIFSALKKEKEQDKDLFSLREEFIKLIKSFIPKENIVYASFKRGSFELEFKDTNIYKSRIKNLKERILKSNLHRKIGEIETIILKDRHYTAILLSDKSLEFLIVFKGYKLGISSILAERLKEKIEQEFNETTNFKISAINTT